MKLFLKTSTTYYNELRQKVTVCLLSNKIYTGNMNGIFIKYDVCGVSVDDNEYDLIEEVEEIKGK